MPLIMHDPAVKPRPDESVRANDGDVCVAVERGGGYWTGVVVACDSAANVVQMGVSPGRVLDVTGLQKGVQPRRDFDANVHRAFGWPSVSSTSATAARP